MRDVQRKFSLKSRWKFVSIRILVLATTVKLLSMHVMRSKINANLLAFVLLRAMNFQTSIQLHAHAQNVTCSL